jgi:hypothetical protein
VTFDQVLQLAYAMKDMLERAEALEAIAEAQAAVGLAAAADTTTDQALQSVLAVSIKGEPGRVTFPSAEERAAQLLEKIARHELEAGDIPHALRIARTIPFVADARARALLAVAERLGGPNGKSRPVPVLMACSTKRSPSCAIRNLIRINGRA